MTKKIKRLILFYNKTVRKKKSKNRSKVYEKKIKREIVKMIGDKLIRNAEQYGDVHNSTHGLFHEVEKPECLKCLEQERMKEEK